MTTLTLFSHTAPILSRLVERHLDGRALPSIVVTPEGVKLSLVEWLETLEFDRSDFCTHLSSRLGLIASGPTVCEAAMSLRDRLIEITG